MAERKVLSKYYPPDFDPSKVVKGGGSKIKNDKLPTVRLMAPFTMQCLQCAEFIPKGLKFNARKEKLEETYFGVAMVRLYIKCSGCKHEITFRTDPKSNDYKTERGAKRITDGWRDTNDPRFKDETEQETLDRLEAEAGEDHVQEDKMAELEDKMQDSKREMQVADALDEIRSRNARIERNEAADKKVVAQKEEERPFIELKNGLGKYYFNSKEEMERTLAEDKLTAWRAFHDEKGNRIKRDHDGKIIKRWTPEEEAQGLHLLPSKSEQKAKPVPGLEDEIIDDNYVPDTRTDDQILADIMGQASDSEDSTAQRMRAMKKKVAAKKSGQAAKRQKR
ncbi:hypothetical protein MYU51_011211 [Penicillium brevicompactum]|uniref:MRNA splicing protein Yju2 n=1 Tax=Penicillium brevicompactum TaxID=5074 RepID=UPI00253FE74A|nr:MRNA splicing protein Yju2 [Penicillium brevicompactum]KAJ5333792.1 MRNA splicing protein Yju2 [Penicillium brevicompactum]